MQSKSQSMFIWQRNQTFSNEVSQPHDDPELRLCFQPQKFMWAYLFVYFQEHNELQTTNDTSQAFIVIEHISSNSGLLWLVSVSCYYWELWEHFTFYWLYLYNIQNLSLQPTVIQQVKMFKKKKKKHRHHIAYCQEELCVSIKSALS